MTENRTQPAVLAQADLEPFRRLSTCVVASAIETFRVCLPNTGFADSGIHCVFRNRPSITQFLTHMPISSISVVASQ